MAKTEITSGVIGQDTYEVGQRVCIVGRGTANLIHIHGKVQRFTATMMVVEYHVKRGSGVVPGERRYRLGRGGGREVGASDYGGSYVAAHCQRRAQEES